MKTVEVVKIQIDSKRQIWYKLVETFKKKQD